MLSFIAKIFIALNSNSRPSELASGIAFGFWLALIPGGNLLWTALFILAFLLKHNLAALLLSMGLFRLVTPLSDALLDRLGALVLENPGLQVFFTELYNTPLVPYSSFNNTVVMGGFLSGLILWIPVYFLFLQFVKAYRKTIAPRLAESKFIKSLKKIPLISKLTKAVRKASAFA